MWMSDVKPTAAPEAPAAAASKPAWRRRWTIVRAALAFCACVIGYTVVFGPDDRLRETALIGAFGLAGAIALGFIGFAVQDDRNWMKTLAARAGGGSG